MTYKRDYLRARFRVELHQNTQLQGIVVVMRDKLGQLTGDTALQGVVDLERMRSLCQKAADVCADRLIEINRRNSEQARLSYIEDMLARPVDDADPPALPPPGKPDWPF